MATYIYDGTYGYGIKFDEKVFFEDGVVRPFAQTMSDISTLLEKSGIITSFDKVCFDRSNDVEYLATKMSADLHPDTINDKLYIKVTYRGKTVNVTLEGYYSDCDCGKRYNKKCDHISFAKFALAQLIQKLQTDYIYSDVVDNKTLFASSEILNSLSDVPYASFAEQMEIGKKVVEHIHRVNDIEYTKVFFSSLMDLNHGSFWYTNDFMRDYVPILCCLLADSSFYATIVETGLYQVPESGCTDRITRNYKYMVKTVKAFDKAMKQSKKGTFKAGEGDCSLIAYAYINNDYKMAIHFFSSPDCATKYKDLSLLYALLKDVRLTDEEEIDVSKALLDFDSQVTDETKLSDFHALASLLSKRTQVRLYADCTNVMMKFAYFRKFSVEEQKELCNNVELSIGSASYIMGTVLVDADDKAKGAYLLANISRMGWAEKDTFGDKFLTFAKTVKNNRILYNYLGRMIKLYDFVADNSDKAASLEEELLPYFTLDYEIEANEQGFSCYFQALNPFSQDVVLRYEERGKKCFEDYLFEKLELDQKEFKALCIKGREEEFNREYRQNQQQRAMKALASEDPEFVNDLEDLINYFKTEDEQIVLSSDSKARLEYYFNYDGYSYLLSLKVGHSRLYVVKDIQEFLNAFEDGQTVTYGKDLVLSHSLDNFSELDREILSMMINSEAGSRRYGDYSYKRFLDLTPQMFSAILEKLEEVEVYFNDKPVLVRLDKKSFWAKIDKTYHLKTTFGNEQEILQLGPKGYVVSFDKPYGYIDRLDNTASEVRVLNFFNKHQGADISPILDQFKTQVYSRNAHMIEVAPELKQDFKLSLIRINSYFDYDDKRVVVREEFEKDGVVVTELQPLDKDKYKLYKDYLKVLGFDDEGFLSDEGKILSFFRMDFSHLRSLSTVYLSESISNKRLLSVSNQNFRITYKSGLMELFLEESEFSEEELATIIKALKKKKKYVILEGNKIVDLDNEEAKEFINTVEDFKLEGGDLHAKKQIPMTTAIKALAHQNNCHVDKYLKNMIEDLRTFKNADIALPKLEAKLRAYQREGFNWLSILSKYGLGGVLADDMGLGKTLQVIATIKADKTPKPSLIVCPKSLVFNWKSEFNKFDGQTEVVEIFGVEKDRSKVIEGIDYKKKVVYITSYDCLRSDEAKYTGQFCYLVLDEAQYIKNVFAQKTQSVKRLDAMHKFALTGTPIENSVVDLWSIFDFILPGYLEELKYFKGAEHDAIKRKIAPFVLRRTKEDVLSDLPAKYERILSTEMSKAQRKVYEAERAKAAKMLEAGGKAFDIFPYLTRLRQICIDPSMYLESFTELSSKLELLKTLIPEYLANGHRILIFSQFVKALNSMEAVLKTLGIPYYLLTGDTKANDRITMMNDFNEGLGVDVFLISLKAGGTGLNLTGADTVIHLDPWWNVAAEDQADDRTHRIGQKRNVEVIKLIAEESIEQRVIELQEIKKNIIDKVISNDDSSIVNATLEDIAFVLK